MLVMYKLLIEKYNKLYKRYTILAYKWNKLVISNKDNIIPFTSNEIKLIMKKCHPDVNKNDYNNKELYNNITIKLLKMYEK